MIRRIIFAPALCLASLSAIAWAADRINASTEGRAGFWATAWGLATGRVPR